MVFPSIDLGRFCGRTVPPEPASAETLEAKEVGIEGGISRQAFLGVATTMDSFSKVITSTSMGGRHLNCQRLGSDQNELRVALFGDD